MKIKHERTTMYIKNRRNSSKIKVFSSYQTLLLTESLVLRDCLRFIVCREAEHRQNKVLHAVIKMVVTVVR